MIPKQKISERILVTNPYTDQRLIEGYQSGFKAGVKFAETELKQIAVDFANYYADMVMAAYNRDADSNLFNKFLSESVKQ